MADFSQLVVALGSPDGDASLVAYASMFARMCGATEVRFVHVAESSASAPALRERMRAHVDAQFHDTTVDVECDVLHGSLTDRLLNYVTEFQADLILIGSKRHKLGARLAMVAPCSVGVIPTGHLPTLSHLMVAFDFSSAATQTLQWATELVARDHTVRCTALHVMTNESTDLFAGSETADEQAAQMRSVLAATHHNRVAIDARLAEVQRTSELGSHTFSPAAAIQGADVAHTILCQAAAAGADCLALGSRGRSRSASILLGSVAEKVIERADIPVLVRKYGRNLGLASILLGRTTWPDGIKTN
jgi:SulP family sulfate permease